MLPQHLITSSDVAAEWFIVDADADANSIQFKTEYWLWNEDNKRLDKLK